jgi:ankyrin repeat protein
MDVQSQPLALHSLLFASVYSVAPQRITKNVASCGLQLEALDKNARTPLHYACYYGTSEVVSELCRHRADVNHVDNKGCTPLHVVMCRQHQGARLCMCCTLDIFFIHLLFTCWSRDDEVLASVWEVS